MLGDGEVREEGVDLLVAEIGGMAKAVEAHVAPHPVGVRLLGAAAVVARGEAGAHLREQL